MYVWMDGSVDGWMNGWMDLFPFIHIFREEAWYCGHDHLGNGSCYGCGTDKSGSGLSASMDDNYTLISTCICQKNQIFSELKSIEIVIVPLSFLVPHLCASVVENMFLSSLLFGFFLACFF